MPLVLEKGKVREPVKVAGEGPRSPILRKGMKLIKGNMYALDAILFGHRPFPSDGPGPVKEEKRFKFEPGLLNLLGMERKPGKRGRMGYFFARNVPR